MMPLPWRAAQKSLQISQRDQVAQSVLKKGDYFCAGLVACAQDLGLPFYYDWSFLHAISLV